MGIRSAGDGRIRLMDRRIPAPVIALIADALSSFETHATLDNLFLYADAPGDPPIGSKHVKALAWLREINKKHHDPISIVGKLVEAYMEDPDHGPDATDVPRFSAPFNLAEKRAFCRKLETLLAKSGFQYRAGGLINSGGAAPSKSLEQLIKGRDLPAIHHEFERALENVIKDPRESLSAACNILESIFKFYVHDNGLSMPAKQDLQGVFKVVRADLGLDAGSVEDEDLKRIISGLLSVVDGIGAIRTHASSAHGQGRKTYNIEPRHARLAVNAAHTLATFVLETWDKKRA